MPEESPRLFGLEKTNRDFSKKESWGKNNLTRLSLPPCVAI